MSILEIQNILNNEVIKSLKLASMNTFNPFIIYKKEYVINNSETLT